MLIHHYIFANQRVLYFLQMRLLYQLEVLNQNLMDLADQQLLEDLLDLEFLELLGYLEDLVNLVNLNHLEDLYYLEDP